MSELVVIGYSDEETAERAMHRVMQMQQDYLIETDEMAVVTRDMNGKYHTKTNISPVAAETTWSAMWGFLFGLLFLVPVAGAVMGGLFGAIFGAFDKAGIDRAFIERVRGLLEPGQSALFMAIRKVTPDKVIEGLQEYDGDILRTSLSADAEDKLKEAMHGEQKVPAGTSTM